MQAFVQQERAGSRTSEVDFEANLADDDGRRCGCGVYTRCEMAGAGLLTTGEAAALIGSSRQHVVDLCDRDDLHSVRVGAHRRIDRGEVDRYLAARGTAVDVSHGLQLWLCRAQAGRITTN